MVRTPDCVYVRVVNIVCGELSRKIRTESHKQGFLFPLYNAEKVPAKNLSHFTGFCEQSVFSTQETSVGHQDEG
jgi:hypothetical protein